MRPLDEERLLLVQMPWASTGSPSIALGILTGVARREGAKVRTLYPNLDLAAAIGVDVADRIAEDRRLYGAAEHLFAVDLFGREALASDAHLEAVAGEEPADSPFADLAFLIRLRDEVIPAFLDATVARALELDPTLVGLTATFNQTMAGLALARRLVAARPGLAIVAGGACFDGEMGEELHRVFADCIAHVFLGEAEESFAEALRRRREGASTGGIPGVTWRDDDGAIRLLPGRPIADLEASPRPDYRDYQFERRRVAEALGEPIPVRYLPFEASRGCWWGQKSHCVFCGINRDQIGFRAKSVDRIVDDVATLAREHRVSDLRATDYILEHRRRGELLSRLAELDLDLELFWEIRADLDKSEIAALKDAGVVRVQPGIEAFSTSLLRHMAKATTAWKQVRFLRWASEHRLEVVYNLLAGFPDDRAEWYLEEAALLPKIAHLPPPSGGLTAVEMHRFSPIYQRRAELGIRRYDLAKAYRRNFPRGLVDTRKVAYFFDFTSPRTTPRRRYARTLATAVDGWRERWASSRRAICEYRLLPGQLRVVDTRDEPGRTITVDGLRRDVLLLCDEGRGRRALLSDLARVHPADPLEDRLEAILSELVGDALLFEDDGVFVTLPIATRPRTSEELRRLVLRGEGAAAERQSAA